MRRFFVFSLVFINLVIFSNYGWASYILNDNGADGFEDVTGTPFDYYVNSGELIGVFGGNNNNVDILENQINAWLMGTKGLPKMTLVESDIILTVYGSDRTLSGDVWTGTDDYLGQSGLGDGGKIDNIADGYKSGTWQVTPSTSTISIYSVKGRDAYGLYFVNPAQNSGSWSTYDLGINPADQGFSVSHLTGFFGGTTTAPEPGTMLLFGLGLLGLSGVSRRVAK